jgi:hypothetical protein
MLGRGVLLKGKNLHSIVIVVQLHVSKFSRALKEFTASPAVRCTRRKVWIHPTFSLGLGRVLTDHHENVLKNSPILLHN